MKNLQNESSYYYKFNFILKQNLQNFILKQNLQNFKILKI